MSGDALRMLVLARDQSTHVQSACADLCSFLQREPGIDVVDVATTRDPAPDEVDADFAAVIGGDGAILRACRMFGERQLPILGINLGRLGFLADLSPVEFREQIDQLRRRNYDVAHHLMFICERTSEDGDAERWLGLNEAAVLCGASLTMIDVRLAINDRHATTYSGDGLIISTPVGSTAHSLSAGGPILQQNLQAFVVTPVCPHTLTIRPLVDHADHVFTLTVPEAVEGVTLVVDGQIRRPIGPRDAIHVRRAACTFQLIRLPGHNYYGILERKLGWTGQPRYQRTTHAADDSDTP